MTALADAVRRRLRGHLTRLYDNADDCVDRIDQLVSGEGLDDRAPALQWTERDCVLITYGDQVRDEAGPPLSALRRFLEDHQLDRSLSTVHLLPFFPYSSDDGFSVIDYDVVDTDLGDWSDVSALGESFDLMFDLVLNHCSSRHVWFRKFLEGDARCSTYFITPVDESGLSGVTRPRSTPLLTEYSTANGPQNVWTTFSADQVDLNFANPDVLLEMLAVLLRYVRDGARIVRLDAIAYLWKTPDTSCVHLPETHEVVKLMRTLLDAVAPRTILLTETNVPHAENVSYFGDGDEAQMVYQFSLAPLLLDAFLTGDASAFRNWLSQLEPPPAGATYFNFTASHDGIGVRPLEGLVSAERLAALVDATRSRGGRVNTRRNPDGSDSPYELNITYFSALRQPDDSDERHVRRFLASQAVMLGLAGIPGIYFHSLVGTPNDGDGVARTGQARSINRRKFHRSELDDVLAGETPQRQLFTGYRRLLQARIVQPAFHPDSAQTVVDVGTDAVIAFLRSDGGLGQQILVTANVTASEVTIDLDAIGTRGAMQDLLSDRTVSGNSLTLEPCQAAWWRFESA